jgi:hypothetical protein
MTVDLSTATAVLAWAIVAFLGIASALLVWNGLAEEFAEEGLRAWPPRRAWARILVGVIGLSLAVWIGLGMLTHARRALVPTREGAPASRFERTMERRMSWFGSSWRRKSPP